MLFRNAIAVALNDTKWAFPLAERIDRGGFAMGLASTALVDLRSQNFGLRRQKPSEASSLLRVPIAFGGMILMTNLRLLGLTFNRVSITQMVTSLRPWKRLGGTVQITTGLLLATSEATKYAPNPFSGPR